MLKVRLWRSKKYLKLVAELGCVICYQPGCAHHKTGFGRGIKDHDYNTFCLCHRHHTSGGKGVAIHDGVETWERIHGSQDYFIKLTQERLNFNLTD